MMAVFPMTPRGWSATRPLRLHMASGKLHLHGVGTKSGGHTEPDGRIEAVPASMNLLPALEAVIQKHGWQRRIAVNISDEPFIHHEQSYMAVVDQVHAMAPSVRIIEAVESEYFGGLDIYVPKLSHLNLWYPRFQEVQREGKELWYYTCCHPLGRYPNRFLDQSLVKARALHWINYLYDLDGYLHWGLNHFRRRPYSQEGISQGLPLGDRAVAYRVRPATWVRCGSAPCATAFRTSNTSGCSKTSYGRSKTGSAKTPSGSTPTASRRAVPARRAVLP